MKSIFLTRASQLAAAKDAANRTMRKAGRRVWDVDDWNVACREFDCLWPIGLDAVERYNDLEKIETATPDLERTERKKDD